MNSTNRLTAPESIRKGIEEAARLGVTKPADVTQAILVHLRLEGYRVVRRPARDAT